MDAIKLEGGKRVCPQIRVICNAGMLVIGHIGLTPQSSGQLGGAKPREEPQIRQWNLSKMPGLYRLQAHLPCWWTYIINCMVDVEDEMNIKTKALRVEVAHVPSTQGVDWENSGIITSDGDCEIYSRPEASFLYDFEACVKNTTLPVMFLSESVNDSRYIQEMAAACVGGKENLREKPFLMAYPEPHTFKTFPQRSLVSHHYEPQLYSKLDRQREAHHQ